MKDRMLTGRLLLTLVIAFVLLLHGHLTFATTTDLFISEYIEGSSYNKAIEIYNGTGVSIDLAAGAYTLELYSNGNPSPSSTFSLSGVVASGDVFVLANSNATPFILSQADVLADGVINFNGNDTIILRRNGFVIDAFGQIGVDPGAAWSGGGVDKTLRRKATICAGDTDPINAFNEALEWHSFTIDSFTDLGSHTADCDTWYGVADPVINEFVANHAGPDFNEFVEIAGDANANYSNYTILEIEGDFPHSGHIDNAYSIGITNMGGYWATGYINNDIENGSLTILLVENFSGAINNDIDVDNDGVIDNAPWVRIADSVAISDGGATDFVYSPVVLNAFYDGHPFTPGGASRFPDKGDTDTITDWVRNDFDGDGLPCFPRCSATPASPAVMGRALNTRGKANAVATAMPSILINELDADTLGIDAAEFVELYDGGIGHRSLNGYTVVFFNGSNDLSYSAFALDGFTTDSNGYFLLGNSSLSPVPSIIFANNTLQNGPDAVALYMADASAFPHGTPITTTNLIDAVVYATADADDVGLLSLLHSGQPQVDESANGNTVGESNQRCPNGTGGLRNTTTYRQAAPTPSNDNYCPAVKLPTPAFIHNVQGNGATVALTGTVVVTATVIGDYQAGDQLGGFFIQEEDRDIDMNPQTSEGIFVYCGGCLTDVAVGDNVEVAGTAGEYFDMSQIDTTGTNGALTVLSSDNPLPTAATVSLPAAGNTKAASTFENLEGMLVTFNNELFVSEYFELARYGQLLLTADSRPRQFTDANEPDVAGYAAFLDALNSQRIILDDDNNIQNDALGATPAADEPYFWPRPGLSNNNLLRGGDSINGLTGIMHWSFAGQPGTDAWRIRPVEEAFTYNFTTNNNRSSTPEEIAGTLKVASFNVLNYFTTLNARGADSAAELMRQRAKTAAAICALNADIVGLIEIENNDGIATADLLNGFGGINAQCGQYNYINTGVIGTDEIAVAFIYKTDTVIPSGSFAILDSSVDARFIDSKNRPALAQTFMETATNEMLTIVVNHLKSKGSDCLDVGDPDLQDGAGNCNLTRANAAAALVDWLATDPTNSGDPDFLIIGDLNAYRHEDPIDNLKLGADDTAGTDDDFTDLINLFGGAAAYSYIFDGQLGYLDHALANNHLAEQVAGVTEWHINADEIPVFDYNDDIADGSHEAPFERESTSLPIYESNVYRASDHDPLIIGLNLYTPPINGYLTIVKHTIPSLPALDWTFEGDLGSFTLDNDETDATYASQLTFEVAPDSYTIRETNKPANWSLNINCDAPFTTDGTAVTVNVAAAANVTCTFVNEEHIPQCQGQTATIWINAEGIIQGGYDHGRLYDGLINGTTGDDVIVGTSGADYIDANNGRDLICADDGDDIVYGGSSSDIIYGEGGADRLYGNNSTDTIYGGPGNDLIQGGNGPDILYGGDDNDKVSGGQGPDTLHGDAGNDHLTGDLGSDSCDGGSGDDYANDSCEITIDVP